MGCSECQYMVLVRGASKAQPALGVAWGLHLCAQGCRAERVGGIGLDSRSCSCSPPGCLSLCPVSAPARIKHYCSSPEIVRGVLDSIPPPSIGNPMCSLSHPHRHRCKQSTPGSHQESSQREPLAPGCPSGNSWGALGGVGMDGHLHWM